MGDEPLTGARFAGDEEGEARGGGESNLVTNLRGESGGATKFGNIIVVCGCLKGVVAGAEGGVINAVGDEDREVFGMRGLAEEGGGAVFESLDAVVGVVMARENDYLGAGVLPLEFSHEGKARFGAFCEIQHEVRDDQGGLEFFETGERFIVGGRKDDGDVLGEVGTDEGDRELGGLSFVIGEEDCRHRRVCLLEPWYRLARARNP